MEIMIYRFVLLLVVVVAGWSLLGKSRTLRETPALTESLMLQKCVDPTPDEFVQLDLATRVLELNDPQGTFGSMKIGAAKTLGNLFVRRSDKNTFLICTQRSLYDRVGIALANQRGIGRHHLVEYELRLASKITEPAEIIVEDVAKVAFAEKHWQSEFFKDEDIRPLARAVLASFRDQASKYGKLAGMQMSSDTALGTGAAQIAVATQQPIALEKTLQMMDYLINRFPADKAIPSHERDRLYELAWALTYSDKKTPERIAMIEKLMAKKVESNATMFGMVELNPKKMCSILVKISANQDLAKFPYCLSDAPYEQ